MIVLVTIGRATAQIRHQWEAQAETREEVRGLLKQRKGCIDVHFLWDIEETGEYMGISYWETLQDLEDYRSSMGREDAIAKLSLIRGQAVSRKTYIVG